MRHEPLSYRQKHENEKSNSVESWKQFFSSANNWNNSVTSWLWSGWITARSCSRYCLHCVLRTVHRVSGSVYTWALRRSWWHQHCSVKIFLGDFGLITILLQFVNLLLHCVIFRRKSFYSSDSANITIHKMHAFQSSSFHMNIYLEKQYTVLVKDVYVCTVHPLSRDETTRCWKWNTPTQW